MKIAFLKVSIFKCQISYDCYLPPFEPLVTQLDSSWKSVRFGENPDKNTQFHTIITVLPHLCA